ncbi:MAG: hypothetical protein ACXWF8_02910 [Methylobacter sp.]
MIEFGITLLVVALLGGLFIYWKKHKGCSSCCSSAKAPVTETKAPDPAKQQPETKPAAEIESAPATPAPAAEEVKVAPAPEPVKAEPAVVTAETVKAQAPAATAKSDSIPEDSVLRRHYVTQLASQAEAPQQPAPAAKPAAAPAPQAAPVAAAKNTASASIPEDSVLKRHHLNQLSAMIEAVAGPRPADSILSRHYDATVAVEFERCQSDKTAMEKLIRNYGNKR